MKRLRLRWWLGLVVAWNSFYVTHWLNGWPNGWRGIALLYLLTTGVGIGFIEATPDMGNAGSVTFAIFVIAVIGLNLTLLPKTDFGPAAVLLGAIAMSASTHIGQIATAQHFPNSWRHKR